MSLTKRYYEEKFFSSMSADDLIDYEARYFIDELTEAEQLEIAWDGFCNSFPPIPAFEFENDHIREAAKLDAMVREVRRRCSRPVAFADALTVAERLLAAAENINSTGDAVGRFTL